MTLLVMTQHILSTNNTFLNSSTLDEMGQRVDELEQNISQLMQQVGSDDKDPAVAADQEIKREK